MLGPAFHKLRGAAWRYIDKVAPTQVIRRPLSVSTLLRSSALGSATLRKSGGSSFFPILFTRYQPCYLSFLPPVNSYLYLVTQLYGLEKDNVYCFRLTWSTAFITMYLDNG